MLILNLGCGFRTSPRCVNIDWSFYLRLKRNPVLRLAARPLLSGARQQRLARLDDSIVVHDLATGVPYPDDSVDAVYHSHMLEHIERDRVPGFLRDVHRVLRPGGIHRICVPDFEAIARAYVDSLDRCESEEAARPGHDRRVAALLEQSVRRLPGGMAEPKRLASRIELLVVGDARRRGEMHQWMYDRINLPVLLQQAGFAAVRVAGWNESAIADWPEIGLETDGDGGEYKPGSLYVEASKAQRP